MELKVGDKVKLNKNVKRFRYGKGIVEYDEIGMIISISYDDKSVFVDFPRKQVWHGLEKELVLAKEGKFFKALPNNFTGTLEVENGYIVDKKILDEEEKEYLSNVIRPFRDKVECIAKKIFGGKEYIKLTIKNDCDIDFPSFEKGTMYKDMEINKKYTLKELEL